jgi:hypothetical protein
MLGRTRNRGMVNPTDREFQFTHDTMKGNANPQGSAPTTPIINHNNKCNSSSNSNCRIPSPGKICPGAPEKKPRSSHTTLLRNRVDDQHLEEGHPGDDDEENKRHDAPKPARLFGS